MMNWWDKNFANCELGDERLSLILHSALAIAPEQGQVIGLLW